MPDYTIVFPTAQNPSIDNVILEPDTFYRFEYNIVELAHREVLHENLTRHLNDWLDLGNGSLVYVTEVGYSAWGVTMGFWTPKDTGSWILAAIAIIAGLALLFGIAWLTRDNVRSVVKYMTANPIAGAAIPVVLLIVIALAAVVTIRLLFRQSS